MNTSGSFQAPLSQERNLLLPLADTVRNRHSGSYLSRKNRWCNPKPLLTSHLFLFSCLCANSGRVLFDNRDSSSILSSLVRAFMSCWLSSSALSAYLLLWNVSVLFLPSGSLQWDTWLYVYIFNMGVIIQISTGTVMKYHVSVDCQQSYIFPKCAALKENIVPRENINLLAPPARDISSVRSIFVILDSQNERFHGNFMCSMTTTKFGNKTRSLRTKQSERKFDSYARVLLWRSIVNHCVLWLRGAFLSGSVS